MAGLTLVIGNKSYSSWSMRPSVRMTDTTRAETEVVAEDELHATGAQ